MTVKIVNVRDIDRTMDALRGEPVEYVGRPSPLGNPFRLGPDGSRAEVIAKYDIWLTKKLQDHGTPQYKELHRLIMRYIQHDDNITLACYCAPQACHADIIKRHIDDFMAEMDRLYQQAMQTDQSWGEEWLDGIIER